MKRLTAFLLVLLMLLPLLSACSGNTQDNNGQASASTGTGAVPVKSENETTELVKEKYAGIDYNGYKFRIFAITPGEHYQSFIADDATEIWYAEDSADAYQHAVFTRNLLAEELLNIAVTPIWGGTCYDIESQTRTLVKAGGDEFDVVNGAQFEMLPIGMENYFINMYDIDTFDPYDTWWDKEYVDTFTYRKHQLYTIVGDYLTLDDYSLSVLFYNKNVIENYHFTDPADLVDAGTWTISNMMEMAEAVTNDLNGDGIMNDDDFWGVLDNGYGIYHFIEGCNAHITELDEDGVPQVVVDKEEFLNTVQYVFEHIIRSPAYHEQGNDENLAIIKDDRAIFHQDMLGAIHRFRDMESDFSLLPIPKLNEEQKDYASMANSIVCTVISFPITVKDTERAGTIMSVLGGMSTDTVDKTLYEVILGPKLFREQRSIDMLRYCLESRDFDWAKDIRWAYPIYTALSEQAASETFAFASALQRNLKVIKAQLRRFLVYLPKD